ncbi:MAG: AsmA-like C-terminal region-containing protein [Opitutaceae bacterium]|nr:AsmA-like C-terminal region-containing protein [Opitutaceae bacterium]
MNIVRSLLIVVAILVVAVALAVIAAFIPAIQRWAVLRVAAGQPGLKLEVEHLALRTGSLKIHNLRLDRQGVQVVLADASVDLSLWEAIAHRRVIMRQANIKGLQVNLAGVAASPAGIIAPRPAPAAPPPPAAAATAVSRAAPPVFDGVFKYFHLPCEIVLEACSIDAELVFPPTEGKPPGRMKIQLTGGHLGPGQAAKFNFNASMQNPDPGAAVDKVDAQGTLALTFDARSRLERVATHLEAVASGPLLPAPARLQAGMLLARTAAGETYALTLTSLEAGAEKHLLGLNGDYVAGSAKLAGLWQVQASTRQVAPFVLGLALPDFTMAGEGRFDVNSATLNVRLTGRLAGEVSRLEVIDQRLREPGRLGATATFDLEYGGDHVRVSELVASLSGRKPVLSLQAIQPFSVGLISQQLTAADPAREVLEVNLEGLPVAWIGPLVSPLELAGDDITGAFVASLRDGRAWLRARTPLAARKLAVTRAGRVLLPASDISVQVEMEHAKEETRLRLGTLTLETPAGDRLQARGEIGLKAGATPATTVQASFEALLPTLLVPHAPVGPVEARGAVAWSAGGGTVQVDRLDAHVLTPEGRVLLELSSAQPFRFKPASWDIATLADHPGDLLQMKFGRLPLAGLKPYLGTFELDGDLLPGELTVRIQNGALQVAAAAPLRVEKLCARGADRAWAKDLTVEIEPLVDCSTQGVAVRLAALRVLNALGATLCSAQAEATIAPDFSRPQGRGSMTFDLSLPALAAQPFLAGFSTPSQGRMSGEARCSYDGNLLGEGRLTLNGLVSPATREPLPVANLSFRAGLSAKGDVAVQAPLLIDRLGERSDLTLAATYRTTGPDRSLDARISGQHFVVDDALALLRAFTAPAAAAGSLPAAPPASVSAAGGPPATAVPAGPAAARSEWAGWGGQVTLDLKSLVYGRTAEITDLAGRIAVDPQRIAVEKITGQMGKEGQIQLNAEARFAAGAPQPYASKLDLKVKDFEIGPLFKAIAPDKPPTVEGRFDVRSQAEGEGRTLAELIEHTRGDFVLQSRKGVFRGLQRAATVSRTASIVTGAARLLGLEEKVGNLVSDIDAAAELAGVLAELPFDQLNVRLSRDQSLNLKLSDFALVSPNVRLQGDGSVTYAPGKNLLDQALQVRVNMGVMGTVETRISRAKLPVLSGGRDELGYMKLRDPFVIGGTLAKPDSSQLYAMLGRSLVDRLLP